MRFSKNVSRGITYVLIVVIIVASAQLVVGSALGSSPVYVVVSSSMVPTLKIGDLVVAHSVPFSNIHVGDVIIYIQPTPGGSCPNPEGLTIVHRVVNITSAGLITQGDNRISNPHPDEPYEWPPVPTSCVKGVVFLAVPYLGLVSMIIPYPYNYILVGLILLFVFLAELRPSKEGKSGEENEMASGVDSGGGGGSPSEREPTAPVPPPSLGTFLLSGCISRTTC
ncbi:MAG: signal peptidase I [Thaumarchaeota archaeon]|nr:signal peptidase I [Nitrososphaerota archaeon]